MKRESQGIENYLPWDSPHFWLDICRLHGYTVTMKKQPITSRLELAYAVLTGKYHITNVSYKTSQWPYRVELTSHEYIKRSADK